MPQRIRTRADRPRTARACRDPRAGRAFTRLQRKNDKQYEGLRKKGMSNSRAAAIANSEGASSRGGKKSGSGGSSKSNSSQGGTSQQKKAAGRKGGKATVDKS